MLLLGELITCSMNSTNRKGKEKKRMGHYYTFDHRRVCRNAFCILHDISVKKLMNLKAHRRMDFLLLYMVAVVGGLIVGIHLR